MLLLLIYISLNFKMLFRRCISFILSILMFFTASECNKIVNANQNSTYLDYPILAVTDFPYGISEVFDDAKDVFRKVLGKMISKKKLVGIDSGWYW